MFYLAKYTGIVILVFISVQIASISCSSQKSNSNAITIEGKIEGFKASKIYLANAYKWNVFLDSAIVTNGDFKITTTTDSSFEPFMACLEYYDTSGKLKTLHFENPYISSTGKRFSRNGFMLEKFHFTISGTMTPDEQLSINAGRETELLFKIQKMGFGYLAEKDSHWRKCSAAGSSLVSLSLSGF